MLKLAQLRRLLYINRVLSKYGLDEIIFAAHLFRPLRFVYAVLPWNWWRRAKTTARGERIRKSLEALGPVFVKFGQILSTRRDLLPEDIAIELAKLQDQVPPFSTHQAREMIERAYGKRLEQVFAHFNDEPLAAASVAQVYDAVLHDGKRVVVKVIRPGIEHIIEQDVALLRLIAEMAERYSKEARRLRPCEIVDDYETTIFNELDLKREAANASLIRRQFEHSSIFYVPEVYWDYTQQNVLVMERIEGISIDDIDALHAAGVNMKTLAERGVEIFFTQVFVHNFFHADMHPGNIFVDVSDPENPRYIGVDFGIVGTLSQNDRRYLAENFLAFFNRDYRRVAELHIDSGWAPAAVNLQEFEAAIRTVCEPIFERPLKEISFGRFLLDLFQTARRFDLHIQPQLVLLQKTLLNIEGMGRQLYPELDLWKTAKPFLQKAMRKEVAYRRLLDKLPFSAPAWVYRLPELPEQLAQALQTINQGQTLSGHITLQWQQLQMRLQRDSRKQFYATVGGSLLVSAALIYGLDGYQPTLYAGLPLPSWLLGLSGLFCVFYAWLNRR